MNYFFQTWFWTGNLCDTSPLIVQQYSSWKLYVNCRLKCVNWPIINGIMTVKLLAPQTSPIIVFTHEVLAGTNSRARKITYDDARTWSAWKVHEIVTDRHLEIIIGCMSVWEWAVCFNQGSTALDGILALDSKSRQFWFCCKLMCVSCLKG